MEFGYIVLGTSLGGDAVVLNVEQEHVRQMRMMTRHSSVKSVT